MNTITDVVEVYDFNHCVYRDGFVFTAITEPANILDCIVIRNPDNCDCWSPKKSFSSHTIDEHIDFINTHKLEKALIIAEDISFITKCPSLKYLEIIPADTSKACFDYSPLYEMPELKYLLCKTKYGGCNESKLTTIDYFHINGVTHINIDGEGHLNYEKVQTLECLEISDDIHENLEWLSSCSNVKSLSFVNPKLKTLSGIQTSNNIQRISIDYGRLLNDIYMLEYVSRSLRYLRLANCPQIRDFTCLHSLTNLEHLELVGSNDLLDLSFLNSMDKLKTLRFSMNIVDCDLTPCLQIPYVDFSKGRKGYNLKNSQLPKKLPTEPFLLK